MNQPQEQQQTYVATAGAASAAATAAAALPQYAPPPQPAQYQQPPQQQPPPPQAPPAVPYQQQQYAQQQPPPAYPPPQGYAPQQYPPQHYPQQYHPQPPGQQAYLIPAPQKPKDKGRQRILIANAVIICLVLAYFVTRPPAPPEYTRLPVDGKSNLTSNAASVEYPQGTAVSEFTEPGPAGETWTAYTQIDNPSSEVELWDRTDAKLTDEAAITSVRRREDVRTQKPPVATWIRRSSKSTASAATSGSTRAARTATAGAKVVSLWVPGTQRSIRVRCEMQLAELERAEAMCNSAIKTLKIN